MLYKRPVQSLVHLVDPTLLAAAAGSIVVLVMMWVIVRRRRVTTVPEGMLVLPHVEMARPRRRLAQGSVGFPGGGVDVAPRSRTLRPTHAGMPRRAV